MGTVVLKSAAVFVRNLIDDGDVSVAVASYTQRHPCLAGGEADFGCLARCIFFIKNNHIRLQIFSSFL